MDWTVEQHIEGWTRIIPSPAIHIPSVTVHIGADENLKTERTGIEVYASDYEMRCVKTGA